MKREIGNVLIGFPIFLAIMGMGFSVFFVANEKGTVYKESSYEKDVSAKGEANDALNIALSSISTDYYLGKYDTAKSMLEYFEKNPDVLEKELTGLMEDYEDIEFSYRTITFRDSNYNEFEAEINDGLVIKSFEMK